MYRTQNMKVAAHLNRGRGLSGAQALDLYGIGHLPRRIRDLRDIHGDVAILTIMVSKRNREGRMIKFASYRLADGVIL